MTHTPLSAKKFQTVPVHCDSFGREVIASNAVWRGILPERDVAELMRDRVRADSIKADADREIESLRRQLAVARTEAAKARADAAQARQEIDALVRAELKKPPTNSAR